MIEDRSYVALSDQWVLFPNEASNILYKISLTDSKYFTLTGVAGVVLALCDGTKRFGDYLAEITELFSFQSIDTARRYFESLYTRLSTNETVFQVSKRRIKSEHCYNPEDFIIPRSAFKAQNRLKKPIRLLIYPTGKCTTHCEYCYADLEHLRPKKDLPLSVWRKILADARDTGIKTIDITGGDLFARSDAAEFVCLLLKFGFVFFLSTKSFISAATAKKIAAAGFAKKRYGIFRDIQLSVDSLERGVCQAMVGVADYKQRMTQTAKNLIDAGLVPKIKSVVTPKNFRDIARLVEHFLRLGVKEFNIVKYDETFYRHNDAFHVSVKQLEHVTKSLRGIIARNPTAHISGNAVLSHAADSGINSAGAGKGAAAIQQAGKNSQQNLKEQTGCSAGRTTLGVLPDGQACLCEQMHMVRPFVFGDLTRQSIAEVWASPEIKSVCFPTRRKFIGTPCYDCKEFVTCVLMKGQCFRDNYFGRNPDHEKNNLFRQPANCYKLKTD